MTPLRHKRRFTTLREAGKQIEDGDLLQFRRHGLIAIAGRGVHSHSAKVAWWGRDLFCLEICAFGGRATMLSRMVQKYPKRIDVYKANPQNRWPEYRREGATEHMKWLCGCSYGFVGLFLAALLHLPFVRLFVKADTDDMAIMHRPPFCSQACAVVDRIGGGVDPVKHLADRITEPPDLARSPFYEYMFTLIPE